MASGRRVSPISRKQPTSRWGTFTTTSRRRMRSARPLWSNVYWNCGRCRNSGTRGAPRKNAFWPVSRIRLKTGIYLRAEDVPSGLCARNCTRRAGLWRRRRRRSSRSCWGGSRINFGRLDGETPHESLLPNFFLHCREYRSWLTGLVILSWWRWKRSGLKIGWAVCEWRLWDGTGNRSGNSRAGVFMKIILIGANGKIGELVQKALPGAGHEIVKVGHKSGDFQVEIENRESVRKLYQAVGSFDAVAIAAGQVAFAPLSEFTAEKWQFSLGSKLMGQINLVQEAIPFIKEKGSFTLVSGILNDEPILAGVAASTISGALEAFVRAAAIELPRGLRINVVSPTMLKESESQFAQFFTGMIPVEGWKVGQAYKRAILGAQTGRVYKVE